MPASRILKGLMILLNFVILLPFSLAAEEPAAPSTTKKPLVCVKEKASDTGRSKRSLAFDEGEKVDRPTGERGTKVE